MKYKNGFCVFATVSAIATFASSAAYSQVLDERTTLQVKTEDCGSAGCEAPARSIDELAAQIGAAAEGRAAVDATNGASGNVNKKGKKNGQGLAIGGNETQIVFLDFDFGDPSYFVFTANPPGPAVGVPAPTVAAFGLPAAPFVGVDHVYTQAERDAIQALLEADYADVAVEFTQTEPVTGEFTTLAFNDNDDPNTGPGLSLTAGGACCSIGFGLADNIDFGNDDRSDNAGIDANFWTFIAQYVSSFGIADGVTAGFLSGVAGLPLDPDLAPADQLTAVVSTAVINQSANTGAHELGHILGLRHHDSIGAPGDGLPTTGAVSPDEFVPVFIGDADAAETILHVMASGASVGLPLSGSTATDRFFSERSVVKRAVNQRGRRISEATATGNNGIVELRNMPVANTILIGENAEGQLDVENIIVEGSLSVDGEVDTYRFRGEAGRVFNAEIISFSDDNIADPIISTLDLFFIEEDGSRTPVSSNAQTFEPFDPLVFDLELPLDGEYELDVSAPNVVFLDLDGEGLFNDPIPLTAVGGAGLLAGDYELLVYIVEGALGNGPNRVPGSN